MQDLDHKLKALESFFSAQSFFGVFIVSGSTAAPANGTSSQAKSRAARKGWDRLRSGAKMRNSYKSVRKRNLASQLYAETLHQHKERRDSAQGLAKTSNGEATASVTSPGRRKKIMKNMADEGEMSESIRAVEDRLVCSADKLAHRRGTETSSFDEESELGRRLRQREQKRQELVAKYGDEWADRV